jgi:putative hydrolase of the HAD superfamily
MPTAVRAVSLDLDNTLWDTPPVLLRAEAALASWLGVAAPRLAAAFLPAGLQRLRTELAARHPERAHDLTWLRVEALRHAARASAYPEALADEAFEVFITARNAIEPYPEVRAALARLASLVPVYALTNGNACVRRVGIGEYFTGAVDAAGAGAAKPDPRIYRYLIGVAALAPAQILHVGDDAVADVHGARAAGLRTAWMNRERGAWPADLEPADHEVHDLAAVVALVADALR